MQFSGTEFNGTAFVLSFPGVAGRHRLEYKDALTAPDWSMLADFTASATDAAQ